MRNRPPCTKESSPRKEPLLPTSLPEYPWQKIGTDLFTLAGTTYIVVTDYFSRYPEVIKLTSTTSSAVISVLKSLFSRHGIPQDVMSDNGPQYASQEFTTFAKTYGFKHTTSSPHSPQSNGHAERAVQTAKKLLKGSTDPYLSLLSYQTTPLPCCGLSPAELLMGRRLRSNIPQTTDSFIPQWPYLSAFQTANSKLKQKQKIDYDTRHGTRSLADNTKVWVTTPNAEAPGCVTAHADAPRSYLVETPTGQVRRNRAQLNIRPDSQSFNRTSQSDTTSAPTRTPVMTRSRTGTNIVPPDRL